MLARDKGKGDLLPEKSGEIKELLEKKNYKKLFISIAARLIIYSSSRSDKIATFIRRVQ